MVKEKPHSEFRKICHIGIDIAQGISQSIFSLGSVLFRQLY